MKDAAIKIVVVLACLGVFGGIIYGGFWVAKTVSYSTFYGDEDMVRQTIVEMVKPDSLKGN